MTRITQALLLIALLNASSPVNAQRKRNHLLDVDELFGDVSNLDHRGLQHGRTLSMTKKSGKKGATAAAAGGSKTGNKSAKKTRVYDENKRDRDGADWDFDTLMASMSMSMSMDPNPPTSVVAACEKVSPVEQGCRVYMDDSTNMKLAMLEAKNVDFDYSGYPNTDFAFNVTDDVDTDEPWSHQGVFNVVNGSLEWVGYVGVPDLTCSSLMAEDRYIMKNDTQLTFTDIPGYPCTEFGKKLIYFMIMEWFYFG